MTPFKPRTLIFNSRSIEECWATTVGSLILLGLALAFYVAWSIGSNDAANPTSTAVGGGALSIKKAVALFSVFAFLGSVIQGWMVIKTFGGGIAEIETVCDALAASMATAFWIIMSSWKGLPISTTHSSVGAVLGIALARCLMKGYTGINYGVLVKVVLSWITSPIGAALLAAGLYIVLKYLFAGVKDEARREKFLRALLIAGLAYSAYAFGANDVGNATGVYAAVVRAGGIATGFDYRTAVGLSMLGAAGIALGGFMLGPRVIRTVAFRITRLDTTMAAAAVIANASVVWVYTTIPTMLWGYGMPISTTHASVSAVLGVGMARHGVKGVNWGVMLKIMLSWLLTVPAAARYRDSVPTNYVLSNQVFLGGETRMCASTWSWLGRRVEREVLRKARDHLEAVKQVAEAVELLFRKFREGDANGVAEFYARTYELEKKADNYKREVIRELSEGYLHPIDREELIRLVLINDDIAAYLKAAGKRATLVDPNAVPENIREILVKMASGVQEASTLLFKAVEIVRSDPKEALRLADEVERIEESIDDIRMEGMKEVLRFCDEVGKVSVCIITKELVDELENSSDECEDSADVIRSIAVMHA